jgi:hypothetical protein
MAQQKDEMLDPIQPFSPSPLDLQLLLAEPRLLACRLLRE